MFLERFLNVFLFSFNPCNLCNLWFKNSKKPYPPKIAGMPQNSTINFHEWVDISPKSLTPLDGPLSTPYPENLLYCRFQSRDKKRFLTVLTGFYSGLTPPKTKKVSKPQKTKISQPRFLGVLILAHELHEFTRRGWHPRPIIKNGGKDEV